MMQLHGKNLSWRDYFLISKREVSIVKNISLSRSSNIPHAQTHINKLSIFWKLALSTFFQKKMSKAIKMQNTRKKQQCTWTNKMVERFNGL